MAQEPEVIEIISSSKRRILYNKINIVLSLLASLLVLAFLVVASLRAGTIRGTGMFSSNMFKEGWVIAVSVPIGIILFDLAIFLLIYLVFRQVQKWQLRTLATPPVEAENTLVSDFRRGLEGVSIAFGQPVPQLMVSGASGTATFSFRLTRKSPVVAVTRQALQASLTDQEAEALMAHEVAHLSLGSTSVGRQSTTALVTYAVFFMSMVIATCATVFVFLSGEPWLMVVGVVIDLLVIVPASLLALYFGRRLRAIRWHNDLLADSLACKATGNPAALKSALIKLRSLGLLGTADPIPAGQTITQTQGGMVITLSTPAKSPWSKTDTVDTEERLRNLEAIELSQWPSFDDLLMRKPGKGRYGTRIPDGVQLAFLSVCVLGLSVLVAFTAFSYSNVKTRAEPVKIREQSDVTTPDPNNPDSISREEYDRLDYGMNYEQVVGITGGRGETLPSGVPAENIEVQYWRSGEPGKGGARLFFTNGRLYEKAWLESKPGPVTQAQLEQLQQGMALDQFFAIAGSPPSFEITNANTRVCFWPGEEQGTTVQAVFVDDACQAVMLTR